MLKFDSPFPLLVVAIFQGACAQFGESLAPRLQSASIRSDLQDQNPEETGFGGGGGGIESSKYFHYQHLPEHDKYEFGYRRGNDHHVREHHEKAVPHEGHFKTKVRWADHKGGHGEHYWDYNHAGHGDDGEGDHSDPVPVYIDSSNVQENHNLRAHHKRQPLGDVRRAYSPEAASMDTQVIKPFPQAIRSSASSSSSEGFVKELQDEIGNIQGFEIQRHATRSKLPESSDTLQPQVVKRKRAPHGPADDKRPKKPLEETELNVKKEGQEIDISSTPQLVFDMETGRVIDERTGKTYLLQPFNS